MATDIIARGMITEYKSGTNISFTENDDGSVTISASGDVSSEDTVARETIDNHKLDKNNPHNVTAEQVGLGNVDNTADLDKPISTAVQTALNGKVDKIDVKDNLESTDTTSPLSANQGKVLNKKITEHTDDSDIHVTASDKENWNSHLTDVSASGNPVQLDGLQGGVPFNSVEVSGKNLIPYPYRNTTKTINGITFTDNGDGTITANGTATANATFLIDKNFGFEKEGNYFLSGCPSGGGNNSFYINWFQNHTGVTIKNYNDYGSGVKIPYQHIFSENNALAIAIIAGTTVENVVFRPQLELGTTPTAYEPPITGRELTVGVSGKNLMKYPYYNTTQTQNGVTFTDNGDGSITVNGTATAIAYFSLSSNKALPTGKYVLSKSMDNIFLYVDKYLDNAFYQRVATSTVTVKELIFNVSEEDAKKYTYKFGIQVNKGNIVDNVTIYPQLELGDTATKFKPYHGATYTITPDSNPYTVPIDIIQQDGINNITVSEGELSVSGVRKNAAIKKIWDKMGMDLLFDGVTSVDNPAVIDLATYKFVEIHHIMIANEKTYPINIRLSLDSYLSSVSTITTPISNSTVNTVHTETGTVSSLYAISESGSNMNNTKIYGIK